MPWGWGGRLGRASSEVTLWWRWLAGQCMIDPIQEEQDKSKTKSIYFFMASSIKDLTKTGPPFNPS